MKKIDMHHHLIEEKNYADALLRTMDRLSIETCALMGIGPLFRKLFVKGVHDTSQYADNDAVEAVCRKHPDRFIGWGFIRLGDEGIGVATVTELHNRGFKGIKFHVPKTRYDDEVNFPVYARIRDLGMPALFHTGVVRLPQPAPGERVSSFNMDCIHLEAIAQEIPDFKIIIAHLGIQNYLTALTLIRIFPNIYADLSSSTPGWRANISMSQWKRLLWFPSAHEKIMFGSDVHESEVETSIGSYDGIAAAAGWGDAEQQNLYYNNARKLLGL